MEGLKPSEEAEHQQIHAHRCSAQSEPAATRWQCTPEERKHTRNSLSLGPYRCAGAKVTSSGLSSKDEFTFQYFIAFPKTQPSPSSPS